jgi:hypothetical protein
VSSVPETREQRTKRLQREIDSLEAQAQQRLDLAERKREVLYRQTSRSSEPTEHSMFMSRVKFRGTSILYTFLFLKTPVGYYTTGSGRNASFRTWDSLLDWLDSEDVESHTGLEAIVATGEMAYPQREREGYPL